MTPEQRKTPDKIHKNYYYENRIINQNTISVENTLYSGMETGVHNVRTDLYCPCYFPIQKFLKILPNISSVVISPDISPRKWIAWRTSMAIRSSGIFSSSPDSTLSRLSVTFDNAS